MNKFNKIVNTVINEGDTLQKIVRLTEDERVGSFYDNLKTKQNKKSEDPAPDRLFFSEIAILANLLKSMGNTIENNSVITAVRLLKQMRGTSNDDIVGFVINKMIKLIQDEKK